MFSQSCSSKEKPTCMNASLSRHAYNGTSGNSHIENIQVGQQTKYEFTLLFPQLGW